MLMNQLLCTIASTPVVRYTLSKMLNGITILTATSPIPISPSSDGVGCVSISVGPRHDYSSLEVVWPERRDTVGRLCYCPPFEGEHHLFSRCISTTSCDTDYSITVSNGSVCFAELILPLSSMPAYFTLLESCANSRCVIRSVLASFIIEIGEFVE